ncbi:prolyl oligopeptidase family serine peptidase [Staphylococcus lloydii]|uniref:alpha/beta hydrolase family protein n=1 Tax=Staphylococcus lloydii TaxID=2781774 RepID=UPI002929F458|nr:prolyl oligopeptidase family serine peptidase [Staphylococcus lloydii]MDU9418009.1 prolyl oligopeptidase family serine peptidase [Staphylococcus lloydii]
MDIISKKRMPIDVTTHVFDEITYVVDGLHVKGLMGTPKDEVTRIVMYLRGGKGQVGKVRAARLLQFVDSHTLVIAPYYRGNNGSEGKDDFYGDDLNDVTQLLSILTHQYPHAFIHMIGFSRGGLQGLLTFQDLPVHSYIIWGGVSDIHLMYQERVDLRGMLRRMVGHPKKDIEAYDKRDAIKHITHDAPAILIIHGYQDQQVGIQQAQFLAQSLTEIGAVHRTVYQQREGHVPRPFALTKVLNQLKQWMTDIENNQLKDNYDVE